MSARSSEDEFEAWWRGFSAGPEYGGSIRDLMLKAWMESRVSVIEECAKVCDMIAVGAHKAKRAGASGQSIEQAIWTAEDIATAIRKLK